MRLLDKLTKALAQALIITGVFAFILVAFSWDSLLPVYQIKSIFTLDTGLFPLTVDFQYVLAFVAVFMFSIGCMLYARERHDLEILVPIGETIRELGAKFILTTILWAIGVWFVLSEFGNARIWAYYLPDVASISRGSFALKVAAIVALGMLMIWFFIIEVRVGKRNSKGSMESLEKKRAGATLR